MFGGLLNASFGWRAIFWFLAILSSTVLVAHALFFPETLRSVVGNGSIPARGLNVTLWDLLTKHRKRGEDGNVKDEKLETRAPRKGVSPVRF